MAAGTAEYEIDSPVFFLEVPWETSLYSSSSHLGELHLHGRARVVLEQLGLSRSSRRGRLWVVIPDDAVGECSALPGGVVRVLVPGTLAIQEPVQVCLVEGGAELGPLGDGDSVVGATLEVPVLGRLGAVVLLPVARWTVLASAFRAVVPLEVTLEGVVLGLVPPMGSLGVFHVDMLVEDHHHVANGFWVALKNLPPQFDAMEALVEVVDNVPVINFH